MVCACEGWYLIICKGLKGQPHGVQSAEGEVNCVNRDKRFGAQPKRPGRSVHLSTENCPSTPMYTAPIRARQKDAHRPLPLTQSLDMPGGRRKRGAHTNAYYNSTRHLAPKDLHCPSPRHDHSQRPKGLGNKGATKDSPEQSHPQTLLPGIHRCKVQLSRRSTR